MNAVANSFKFIINTLPIRMDSLTIFTAPGGVFVQVGLPSVYDEGLQFLPAEIVIKEIMIVGSCVGPRPVIKEMIPL